VLFFPNDAISLPLPMVDRKVRGFKSVFVAVVTLFDTKGRPNGSAARVIYGGRGLLRRLKEARPSRLAFIPDENDISNLPAWVKMSKQITEVAFGDYGLPCALLNCCQLGRSGIEQRRDCIPFSGVTSGVCSLSFIGGYLIIRAAAPHRGGVRWPLVKVEQRDPFGFPE
jgi:hypothetical protein